MDRLLAMEKEQFITKMQEEFRKALGKVADAVNNAPDGQVISGSEVAVRDAMVELQRKAMETAVQMRIDSTESSFSPSAGHGGQAQAEQGALSSQHPEPQRTDRVTAHPLARRGRRK
jgi:hypothetical protein